MSSYAKLIMAIKKYESDTFSASNAGLTSAEAEKVADVLVDTWMRNSIDGPLVAGALSVVRGRQ